MWQQAGENWETVAGAQGEGDGGLDQVVAMEMWCACGGGDKSMHR